MSENDALQNLVTKVERELRFWQVGRTFSLLCVILAFTVAANDNPGMPQVLQARESQLVDEIGTVRATLKTLGASNTQLRLYGGFGKSEVAIGANEQRAIVEL